MPATVAVIVAEPGAAAAAIPVALMAATAGTLLLQLAVVVRSWTVPSARVPVAVSWRAAPAAMAGFTGLTAIEASAGAAVTVRVVVPVIPARAAPIVACPFRRAVASPAVLTVATADSAVDQAAAALRSWVLPSE